MNHDDNVRLIREVQDAKVHYRKFYVQFFVRVRFKKGKEELEKEIPSSSFAAASDTAGKLAKRPEVIEAHPVERQVLAAEGMENPHKITSPLPRDSEKIQLERNPWIDFVQLITDLGNVNEYEALHRGPFLFDRPKIQQVPRKIIVRVIYHGGAVKETECASAHEMGLEIKRLFQKYGVFWVDDSRY